MRMMKGFKGGSGGWGVLRRRGRGEVKGVREGKGLWNPASVRVCMHVCVSECVCVCFPSLRNIVSLFSSFQSVSVLATLYII